MRRLLAFSLIFILVLSMAPAVFASEIVEIGALAVNEIQAQTVEEDEDVSGEGDGASCGTGLSWYFNNGTLTVSGSGEMDDFAKGAPWAELKDEITSVVLQDGVQSVGAYAFENYDKLTSIDFGDSLKYLGKRCLASCDGLTSISLPKTFKRFDEEALRGCKKLTEIHCAGSFPRFELNCLWETECKLYYPASAPWSTVYIEQLENAFHGRIEFLDSDGVDHYTYTEPTEAPTTEPTTAPTTAPTTEPTTEPTTVPAAEETTEPIRETAEETAEAETVDPTRETFLFGTQATTQPEPTKTPRRSGGLIGGLIVIMTLSACGIGALAFRAYNLRDRED